MYDEIDDQDEAPCCHRKKRRISARVTTEAEVETVDHLLTLITFKEQHEVYNIPVEPYADEPHPSRR